MKACFNIGNFAKIASLVTFYNIYKYAFFA